MTTICYYSTTGGSLPLIGMIAQELAESHPEVTIIARGADQLVTPDACAAFAQACAQADATVLTLHGGLGSCPAWPDLQAELDRRRERGTPWNWLHIQPGEGDDDAALAATEYGAGIEDGSWQRLVALLRQGGLTNLRIAIHALIDRANGRTDPIPDAVPMPYQGIAHPRYGLFTTLADYLAIVGRDRPVIGVMYPHTFWVEDNHAIEDALVDALEAKGAIAVPVFCNRWADSSHGGMAFMDVLTTLCKVDNELALDAMVDLFGMSMVMIDPGLANVFADLDIPVLHGMTSYAPVAQWAATNQGLGAMDVSVQAAGPEFDGEIIAAFLGTRELDDHDPLTGALVPRRVPIPDRIEAMANQALAWARLRRTPNADKRIAMIVHHNPPRADKIGCAFGLDSFESIRRLLLAMGEQGYAVGEPFPDGDAIADRLLAGLTCDQRFLDTETMCARAEIHAELATSRPWFDALPTTNQADIQAHWGTHPGELFVHDGAFAFAGFHTGNVYLTIQPPRGAFEAVDDRRMHDDTLPPTHHYLAHYRYIRDGFKADAVIHVGTHGTLEWLPGKGLGLSETCYPEVVLTHLPNIYPYIINNPGEGTQAKRRSAAVIIDHLTPPMRAAGLYDALADVDAIIREYAQALAVDQERARQVAERLWPAVQAAGLDADLGITEEASADLEAVVEQVNHYLMHLAEHAIADGLHVLGEVVADGGRAGDTPLDPALLTQRMAAYLAQLVRLPNGDIPSLRESILEAWGTTLTTAHQHGTQPVVSDGRTGTAVIADADAMAITLMHEVFTWWSDHRFDPNGSKSDACDITKHVLGRFDKQVCTVVHAVIEELLWRLEATQNEITATLDALQGRFVPAGPSGAPTRGNALILPTGRNFYSIDPLTMPTPTAWEEGKVLADQMLARYAKDHPDDPYPNTVGMVVWGSANMRSGGTDIAEILYLYGIKPVWASNGHMTGLEVIPIHELGRPRIDAAPRVSGFFRDAFPNLVDWLDLAARMVAALDEPPATNRIRAHVVEDVRTLIARGIDPDTAMRKATLRVFGCQPGTYGVGIETRIETGTWETKADLARQFISDSAYGYGEGVFGDKDVSLYERRLASMDVVVKNEDTREYDMLSCTDFYNEFGGLVAASTHIRGVPPSSYVGDMADPRRIQTRSTVEEARLILRSRILNPAWVHGLQRHGFKGAGDLSKVLDILIGWDALADVVDDHLWSQVAQTYAFDLAMQAFLHEHNPHALYNIAHKLLDTAERGIWAASGEAVDRLKDLHDQIEGDIEALMDDPPAPSTSDSVRVPKADPLAGIDLTALGIPPT